MNHASRGGSLSLLAVALVAGPQAFATETTAGLTIGGPHSCSSEGFNDPGRLSDGITEASAQLDFILDDVAGTLTVDVTNTSPVILGVSNPVLTAVYFNAPVEVTGMTLVSQTGSGGPDPGFVDNFDANGPLAPNPNGAGGFGAYTMALDNPNGVNGAIANATADTYGPDVGTLVMGPVTFVFDVTGDLGAITASDFANAFSTTPPGNKPANGVAKFQSGGVAGASAFISNGVEECFMVVGSGSGDGDFTTPFTENYTFDTHLNGVGRYYGVSMAAPLTYPKPTWNMRGMDRLMPMTAGSGPVLMSSFNVQVVMFNPEVFPGNPAQWSPGLEVMIWSDGSITSTEYGSSNSMDVMVETYTTADGREFLRFPFLIDGVSGPNDGPLSLSAYGYKIQGHWTTDLVWVGSPANSVDIYREGEYLTTVDNDGFYIDYMDFTGSGTLTYQICEAGTNVCSNLATATYGDG